MGLLQTQFTHALHHQLYHVIVFALRNQHLNLIQGQRGDGGQVKQFMCEMHRRINLLLQLRHIALFDGLEKQGFDIALFKRSQNTQTDAGQTCSVTGWYDDEC